MTATLTVTAKGQITLRKEVREHLGVRPGGTVNVDLLPNGQVLLRVKSGGAISSIFGMLAEPGTRRHSVEERTMQRPRDGRVGVRQAPAEVNGLWPDPRGAVVVSARELAWRVRDARRGRPGS